MRLSGVRDWVFDLDNTLYPVADIYDAVGARMTDYIARELGLAPQDALALQERYFHQYGATVVGLARHHGVDAANFLRYAHDVDYSLLSPDAELAALLDKLPGRKFVFTNGGGGHGKRALAQLGLTSQFEAVFDIEDAALAPKPDRRAYELLVATHGIAPRMAALVEDTLKNLPPAHEMGFATVLVGAVHPGPGADYVDIHAADVKTFLRAQTEGA